MNHVTDTKLIFYQPKLRRVSIQKTKTKKKLKAKSKQRSLESQRYLAMKKLFDNFKILIIKSVDLPDTEVQSLAEILQQYSVEYEVLENGSSIDKEELITKEFTHILSNNINFELYSFAQENMIPVSTSDFIYKTVELQRQPPIRPFSPDPKHVLKDIHVCVGGLPLSDKEAIFGGVRALGGCFSDTLNKFVTHLISTDSDEDCCIAVNSIEDCKIKIVLPNWIDDCLKLRKKLDETPYLLEDGGSVIEQQEKLKEMDVVNKDAKSIKAQAKFLNNKRFYIGKDLELTQRSHDLIVVLIENSGGVVENRLNDAQFYIGKFRDGDEYRKASRTGLNVGNLNWIYWMVEHQKYISPYLKLLHYPYVRHGMPQMKKFVIASTNYSGDARFYILKLVEALGAEFTTSLKQRNTHLITATPVGAKYNAAKKWGNISVVNHLWLEETYASWKLQSASHPRYSHFPRSLEMSDIVGETPLDIEVLKHFYDDGNSDYSANVIEDSEGEDEHASAVITSFRKVLVPKKPSEVNAPGPIEESTRTPSKEDSQKKTSLKEVSPAPTSAPKTPAQISKTPAAKIASTPDSSAASIRASSGRKAKDKAAAKLHENMEELNYFQKQHRSKDIPMLPQEIEERKRKRALEESEKKKRQSPSSAGSVEAEVKEEQPENKDSKAEAPKPKKAKKSSSPVPTENPYNITAIATGWDVNFNRADTQILHNLGITLHKEFKKNINAIISPKFMRTEKFLTGLSYKLDYIISPLFLQEVISEFKSNPNDLKKLPKVEEFSIDKLNPTSVKELTSISLSKLMNKSKTRINSYDRIFEDMSFNITPKIPGGAATVQKILKAHGAKNVNVIKTVKDLKNLKSLVKSNDESYVLISSEKNHGDKFQTILKDENQHGKVIEWNWVIDSIFNMEINDKKNVLFSN